MSDSPKTKFDPLEHPARIAALKQINAQRNEKGLWPYLPAREAAIEPSVWSAFASRKDNAADTASSLISMQNQDGGWSSDGNSESDWSTAVSLLGLGLLRSEINEKKMEVGGTNLSAEQIESSCQKAHRWLMENRTEHYSSAARFALLVWKGPTHDYERGWSWTQNTFDWVEPTAYVLLSLRQSNLVKTDRESSIVELAEEFLLSLVCKDGGWNFGDRSPLLATNPPDVQSSVLALLALKGRRKEAKVLKSIDWLKQRRTKMESVSELSWTALGLASYGKDVSAILDKLAGLQDKSGSFSSNLLTQAIACLAFETAANHDLISAT